MISFAFITLNAGILVFKISIVNAASEEQAIAKGNLILQNLSGDPKPENGGGIWGCEYTIDGENNEYFAVAACRSGKGAQRRARPTNPLQYAQKKHKRIIIDSI